MAKNANELRIEMKLELHEPFPAYAWPGGYPVFYAFADGGVCCPDCANGKNDSDAASPEYVDSVDECDAQWRLVASEVNYEDEDLQCAHCNILIPAAIEE